MDPQKLIVLYSKYSNKCKSILELYDEMIMVDIKLICIDNTKIRQQIARHNIKTVPCILFIYPDKKFEKFEGPTICNWIIDKMRNIHSPLPPIPEPQFEIENDQSNAAEVTRIENLMDIEEDMPNTKQNVTSIDSIIDVPRLPSKARTTARKEKSLAEKAAEMAAAREGADKPAHLHMQEQQQKQIEASMNGKIY